MKLIKILSLLSVTLSLTSITQAQTWQPVTGTPAGVQPSAIGAGSGNTLYSAFGGSGVYKSTDNGATWTKSSSGLESVAGDANSATIDGRSFIKLGNRIVHGTTVSSWRNGVGPGAFYSDDGGTTWTPGSTPGTTAAQFRNMVQLGNYCFAADTLHGIVWRSTDNGANWTSVRNGVPNAPFSGVSFGVGQQVTVAGTRVLLATKIWGLYASDDLGNTWYEANNGIPLFPYQILPFRNGYDIVTATNGTVFASVDGSIYHSTNQGSTFSATFSGLSIGNARRLVSLGDKIYGNTPSSFFEIDINTYSVRTLPFTGMDNMSDDVFYAYNGYLYCGTTTSLRRLNLGAAPRTNLAPVINENPVGGNKLAGQSITFSVKASGTLPLTYQWRKGGQNILNATSATYTIASLSGSDTDSYDVVVTGPGGSTTSTPVALNVQSIVAGTLDSTWGPNASATGKGNLFSSFDAVAALVSAPNNQGILVGGQWDNIRGDSGSSIAADDFIWMDYNGNRTNSSVQVQPNGVNSAFVEDIIIDSQGKFVVVGFLKFPTSSSTTTNAARFNNDLSPDNSFKVAAPDNRIRVIKQLPNNKYVVGGDFTTIGGQTRKKLAILNNDGSVDTTVDPFGSLSTVTSVMDLDVLPDGSILVAGDISAFSGSDSYLVKITPAGIIDTTFVVPVRGSSDGKAVLALPNGKIYLGGSFSANENLSGNQRALVRLNADGSLDNTFNVGGAGLNGSGTVNVWDLFYQPDGKVLVAGKFSSFNAVAFNSIFRLLQNGALDTSATFPSATGDSSNMGQTVLATKDGLYIYLSKNNETDSSSQNQRLVRYLNTLDDPAIAAQPASTVKDKNGNVAIKAAVYSTSTITYQWYKNGVAIDGQTTDTLTLNNVQENDGALYTLKATTQGRTLETTPAELRVLAAPVIANSPVSMTLLAGKPLSLTVDAYGQTNNLGFKWFKDGVALWGGAEFTRTITGTNTLTYSNSVLRFGDSGTYRLIVTNLLGRATTDVQVAVLPQAAHLAPTYVGPGQGSASRFNNSFLGDDGIIVAGTNLYIFGVYTFGGQERYGIGKTDFNLNTKDLTFNPPFDYSTYTQPRGGFLQSDGKIVIYGTWTSLSNYSRILRLNPNGTVDTTFKTNGFPDQNIDNLIALPNDKFAVYGNAITKIGNHSTAKFAVYNADGSPDTTFKVSSAAIAQLNKLGYTPGGKLLVANNGSSTFNGQSVGYLFQINMDGTLDTSFTHSTLNNTCLEFDFMTDGRIVVGGNFTTVGGFSRPGLARLLADGTRDTSFTLTNAIDTSFYTCTALIVDDEGGIVVGNGSITGNVNPFFYGFRIGPDNKYDPTYIPDNMSAYVVGNMKKLPDGRIIMGAAANGVQGSYNGKTITGLGVLYGYPAKLGIIQHPLTQFVPLNGSTTLSVLASGTAVWTYQWYKDGLPIAGATSSTLPLSNMQPGDAGKYTVKVQNIFRTLYSNPASVTVLAAPQFIKQPTSVSARLGQTVKFEAEAVGLGSLTFQWQKDGVDIPGETGTSLSLTNVSAASSAVYRLVAFNSLATAPNNGIISQGAALSVGAALAGTIDTSFAPGSGMQRSGTVLGLVEAVLWDSQNKPVIGGFFDTINGSSRPNLARFNNDGSPDTTFASAGGPNNYVFDIIKASNGQLYIGGSFGTYASTTQNRVARLNTDGSRDSTFASTTAPANNVYRIVEAKDGKIFAGHNGTAPCVWKYNTDGTRDTGTFTFSGNYNPVYAISLYGNTQFLVDGGAGSYHYSYRYGTNGTYDNTWTSATSFPISSSSYVYDIGVLPDGRALVGGTFANPDTIQGLTNLVVLGTNGRIVANTSSNLVTDGIVYDIYVYPDGKVLIGGSFTNVNRIKRPGIARLNADLSVDTTFDPGQGIQVAGGGTSVNSIDVRNDGKILVGGYFDTFDGAPRNGVVVLNGDPSVQPLNITGAPQAQVVVAGQNATFSVAVNGGTTLNFQWYKDNVIINNATNPYVTITNATFASAGNYKVTITSGADSTTSTPVSLTVTAPTSITFGDWRSGYSLPIEQIDPDADPDGDGLPNVVEYVLGTDPTQTNERPKAQKTNFSGIDYPAVKIKRLKAASGFDILVEASQSLDFSTLVDTTLVGITDLGNGLEELNVRINDPLINTAQVYFRIKVAQSVPK